MCEWSVGNLPATLLRLCGQTTFHPHTYACKVWQNHADQEILFSKIIDEDLSVRQAETLAQDLNSGKRAVNKLPLEEKPAKSDERAPVLVHLEEKFLSATGYKVEIKGKVKNGIIKKGKVLIPFTSEEELEQIYQILAPGDELYE